MKPAFKPNMAWIEGTNKFAIAAYKRDDNYICLVKIFTVGTDYD